MHLSTPREHKICREFCVHFHEQSSLTFVYENYEGLEIENWEICEGIFFSLSVVLKFSGFWKWTQVKTVKGQEQQKTITTNARVAASILYFSASWTNWIRLQEVPLLQYDFLIKIAQVIPDFTWNAYFAQFLFPTRRSTFGWTIFSSSVDFSSIKNLSRKIAFLVKLYFHNFLFLFLSPLLSFSHKASK